MYNTFVIIFAIILIPLVFINIMISFNLDMDDLPGILIVLAILSPVLYGLLYFFPVTAPIIFYWTYYLFRKNRE